ncbi:MAG: hypothetical protein A3F83_02350 [Candidatus Glassbacteria bacterium RIFCSPLOWO2_12_FULL_58_11]|uniref:Inner membrane protein YgaP-like transmembrane domain-containing protein n=2 Tax=Candidatus Glassiibacteriota TaxID=1817805 RepID=A0A1F5YLE2_9BACT|nr:MAG: hypothetical protein A2Z86_01820 [Candidatus Glassbacteria bacterium GWA2_58_10]OGG00787.1 MAG: hypothetical protein A3F83_02350 [Candidatus Glassbacteria bacterium RIFCSPLOWO2_12_FULL_58_11]
MQCNIGSADKAVRIVLGLAIIGAGLYFKSWWGAIGVLPLTTAIIGYCPAYPPFGINTTKKKKEQTAQ